MSRPRILIASVLKPVDDTRMLEKMAHTLSGTEKYEVWVAGFPASKSPTTASEVHLISLPFFERLSLSRLLAPFQIFQIARKVKPQLLIVNTHELLIVGMLNRIFFGTRIVYDVRENYFRNILYTDVFPWWLRPFLAGWVRLNEWLASPFVHRFLLAEKGYEKEMHFFGNRAVVIENKAAERVPRIAHPGKDQITLLFSGTLAESTGVFDAIELAGKLHKLEPKITLKIIGYAASPRMREQVRNAVNGKAFIELLGIDQLVPHRDILRAIGEADFGLIAYPPSRHTENAIPTKLYEYLAAELPILMVRHPGWEALCNPYTAALSFDWQTTPADQLLIRMQSPFYLIHPADVTWDSEAPRLLEVVKSLLSK